MQTTVVEEPHYRLTDSYVQLIPVHTIRTIVSLCETNSTIQA